MLDEVTPTKNLVGTLVLVVGPSGVGKDTLLDAARRLLQDDPRFHFPRRIITRKDTTGEDHIPVGEQQFHDLKHNECFLLDWNAHGYRYGIPIGAEARLQKGECVVVNTSRQMIDPARERWRNVKVLHVTVHPDALRQRLQKRGRESAREIELRIKRAGEIEVAADENTMVIDNSGPLQESTATFNKALASIFAGDSARSA